MTMGCKTPRAYVEAKGDSNLNGAKYFDQFQAKLETLELNTTNIASSLGDSQRADGKAISVSPKDGPFASVAVSERDWGPVQEKSIVVKFSRPHKQVRLGELFQDPTKFSLTVPYPGEAGLRGAVKVVDNGKINAQYGFDVPIETESLTGDTVVPTIELQLSRSLAR
jgi:hypothetical protein